MKILRDNAPFALFVFNIALALLILVGSSTSGGGYQSAAPLLDLAQSDVAGFEFRDPRGGVTVTLTRGVELPPEAEVADEDEGFSFQRSYDRVREELEREARYTWELKIARRVAVESEDGPARTEWREQEFAADADRVAEFFNTLKDARRYYSLNRTPEQDRDLDLGKNDRGEYDAPALAFQLNSGREQLLYLGRTRAGASESYVRIGEQDRIYLVETDLRTALGEGEPQFFRDRGVWPEPLSADGVTAIEADFPGRQGDVELVRGGDEWRLSKPEAARARTQEVRSLIEDLIELKAEAFVSELPDDLEEDSDFELEISYKDSITGAPRPLRLEILGKQDYSSYYVRRVTAEGADPAPLVKVTSVYIGSLYEPDRRLVERAPAGSVVPGAPEIPLQ